MDSHTFHPFPRLPAELRLMIWEAALHPHEPSAQFFSLANKRYNRCEEDLYMGVAAKEGSDLAAPRCRQTGELSWTTNNRSAYMIDHGLWTASKESRAVMLKYHQHREKAHNQKPLLSAHESGESESVIPTTVKGRFLDKNHAQRYISFDPDIDLLSVHLPLNKAGSCLGLFDTARHLLDAKNMAVEYIPGNSLPGFQVQLVLPEHRALLEVIAYSAQFLSFRPTFWFIDFQVILKPGHTYPNDRTTFKGLRCKFIEIKETDECWDVAKYCRVFVNGIERVRQRSSYHEVFEMTSRITCEVVRQSSQWIGLRTNRRHVRVRALACIPE
ncbi:hypothetical protein GGR57DRAFT_511386 [Xylariaceae sp. FL1272]|nr:hypothetical protein GGR57DRAFT_511386 [Xylariaceae sp. FL1272]